MKICTLTEVFNGSGFCPVFHLTAGKEAQDAVEEYCQKVLKKSFNSTLLNRIVDYRNKLIECALEYQKTRKQMQDLWTVMELMEEIKK